MIEELARWVWIVNYKGPMVVAYTEELTSSLKVLMKLIKGCGILYGSIFIILALPILK